MMSWNISIIVICILLTVFAIYREYQRANKAHLWWRVAAALIIVTALACIILPITYATNATQSTVTGKILLTNGFTPDSLKKADSVYTLDNAVHQQYPKAKLLTDVQELFKDSTHITPIHVLGYGLGKQELAQLKNRQIIYHSSPIPDGFTAISWTEKIKAGQPFKVQGTYKNTSAKAIKIILKGLNTTMDSTMIPQGSEPMILLSGTPKNTGRVIYDLIAISGKDTVHHERLPIIIEPTQPIKVLLLSASPDFETKFLKNWLGGNGYGVASRSVISKDKFGQEFVNMDQQELSRITAPLLSKFDLIIGDLSVFKSLSTSENFALQQEVNQKGLGIIIRSDSSVKGNMWLQNGFIISHQTGKPAAPSTLHISGKKSAGKLTIDPDFIIAQSNTQALITDEYGRSVAGIAMNGAGKTIFTTINNTYSWMLAGNQADYNSLWSTLIDKALRKSIGTENWLVATSLPSVDQPTNLILESSSLSSGVLVNQTLIYPSQNTSIPFRQEFTYWPVAYGWQQVKQQNGKPYWWYTWQKSDWKTLKAAESMALTKAYAKYNAATLAVTKQIQQKSRATIPKIYFYILFLVAATFLWAESKFFS